MPPRKITPNTVGTMKAYFSGGKNSRMGLPVKVCKVYSCSQVFHLITGQERKYVSILFL